MNYNFTLTPKERSYLRELAKKQLEYANLPIMSQRKKLWYAHNALEGERPVVVMEMDTFEMDMFPPLKCESEVAKDIEKNILRHLINYEHIDDDKVVPNYYTIYWKIELKPFGVDIETDYASDEEGRNIGFAKLHPVHNLKEDLPSIKPSIYSVDRAYTLALKNFVEDIIGDILPVKLKNNTPNWFVTPSQKVVDLMGLENMMYAMLDYPDEMHDLYGLIRDDIMKFVKWQEQEGLLCLNNENDYAGAGSYGFTTELPAKSSTKKVVTAKDIWINMNSQETVGISPTMYGEFIYPYYRDLADKFGLVYYGCCEPVHEIWEEYISHLPNLRKVSISPWCDEEFMGHALKGQKVIYSRKPKPNFIGVGQFDEMSFRQHIHHTLNMAKGCNLEFIFRDIYTLCGDQSKPGRAVAIVRELIDELW